MTLFVSAWRNPSLRYFLHSDIFIGLAEARARLVFFVLDEDLQYYQNMFSDKNIIFEPIKFINAKNQLGKNALNKFFLRIRKFMSGSQKGINNTTDKTWIDLYEFSTEKSFRSLGISKIITGIASLGRKFRFVRDALVFTESFLSPGKIYDSYFKKYHPHALVVSSVGYGIDPLIMRSAKRHNCPIISVVHSWDNPTTKGYRGAKPDAAIAWNYIMAEELHVFQDIPREDIFVEGIAHWDHYFDTKITPQSREVFFESLGLDPGRKLILYGTSAPKMFPNTFDAIGSIMLSIEKNNYCEPSQLIVRLHPAYFRIEKNGKTMLDIFRPRINDLEKRYGSLIKFAHPGIETLKSGLNMPKEDMLVLAETLRHADVLLTEYSTLIIEAAIVNTPIINVAIYGFWDTDLPAKYFENYMHLKVIIESKACRNAYTLDELNNYINLYLKDNNLDHNNRVKLAQKMVPVNRGTAGQAVAERILSLAAGPRKAG